MPDHATLRRLIYRSRSRLAGGPVEVARELGRILETSRRRNLLNRVTGVLMLREAVFVQLLEGPAHAVGETYARITGDARHDGIETLEDNPAAARIFADWTMAYAGDLGLPDIPLTLSLAGSIMSGEQAETLARLRAHAGAGYLAPGRI